MVMAARRLRERSKLPMKPDAANARAFWLIWPRIRNDRNRGPLDLQCRFRASRHFDRDFIPPSLPSPPIPAAQLVRWPEARSSFEPKGPSMSPFSARIPAKQGRVKVVRSVIFPLIAARDETAESDKSMASGASQATTKPYLIETDDEGRVRLTVRTTRYNRWNYPIVSSSLVEETFTSVAAARAHAKKHFGAEPGQFTTK
jgi:hypothetical protein